MRLTIALQRYDRHFPFFDNTVVPPENVQLQVLQVGQSVTLRDGTHRHKRMLDDKEFDICEFSMSSFLMAKERRMDIIGLPISPRRLFSASQMFVHPDFRYRAPEGPSRKKSCDQFVPDHSVFAGQRRSEVRVRFALAKRQWFVTTKEKIEFEHKKGVYIQPLDSAKIWANS